MLQGSFYKLSARRILALLTVMLCQDITLPRALPHQRHAHPDAHIFRETSHRPPRFGDTPTNVTGISGNSAFLPCTVTYLGDRSVTWMRQRDLHILTAGIFTYSADERFQIQHPVNGDDWTLEIRYVTERDSGMYECHVNSDPKMSRQVYLHVREHQALDDLSSNWVVTSTAKPTPVVSIEGPSDRHIQAGSILSLTCIIQHPHKRPPIHILWFHDWDILDYDSPRGGVSIQTETFAKKTRSQVMLSNVRYTDSGEYSCSPSDLPPSVITVHVQEGQHQAAVQQGSFNSSSVTHPFTYTLFLLLLLVLER